jgi:hypothetical protein
MFRLEFFWVDEHGRQEELARQSQTAPSSDVVEARARATLKNVLLKGRRSNLCVIKDARGKALTVVIGARQKAVA